MYLTNAVYLQSVGTNDVGTERNFKVIYQWIDNTIKPLLKIVFVIRMRRPIGAGETRSQRCGGAAAVGAARGLAVACSAVPRTRARLRRRAAAPLLAAHHRFLLPGLLLSYYCGVHITKRWRCSMEDSIGPHRIRNDAIWSIIELYIYLQNAISS